MSPRYQPSIWLHLLRAVFALLLATRVGAEDIDLFVGAPTGVTPTPPNVLFIVDNTANWNTAFTNEMAALNAVFNGLPTNADGSAKFNVGIMFFTESGGSNNGPDGGYVRAAIRPMTSINKTVYSNLITSFDRTGDATNGGKAGKTMAEAYFYFASGTPNSGTTKTKTDYTGNSTGTAASNAVYALTGNALSSFAGTKYTGPDTSNCAKNYIIYISNSEPADNLNDSVNDSDSASKLLIAAGGTGSDTRIVVSPQGSGVTQANRADEWARFMKRSPEQITVYTLDIDKKSSGQGPAWTAILKSMASVSQGKYFDVSSGVSQNIVDALNTVLSEILAVNTVFASVSLPAASNTQSTFLNQVYIGMFRPDGNASPRWPGNLKQYKLGLVSGNIKLLDANDATAINPNTGFITECARSFWTPTAVDTYWATGPQGDCNTVANSDASNYPDGPIVEKGAQGFVLRGSTTRTVNTCSATFASCTELTTFNTTNVTKASLGNASMSNAQHSEIINWARGLDVKTGDDERVNGVTSGEMRATAHGDVVHSRPVAINYGGDDFLRTDAAVADAEVVVYYSGNDGMLRAINGNRTGNIGSFTPGQEIWSFVAPEFLQGITRNYNNTTIVSYPANTTSSTSTLTIGTGSKSLTVGTNLAYSAGKSVRISYDTSNVMQGTVTSYSASTGDLVVDVTLTDGSGSYSAWKVELGLPKNYAIDGPITAWQGVVGSSGSKVFLYAGMRRGGRALYAFDVTDKTSPSLKWKRGCPNLLNDTNCTNDATNGDWRGIGQTWSPATLVKVRGFASGGNPVPLLLMGGGYDDCEDTDGGASGGNHSCSSTKGNRVYVINADTGAILQSFNTLRAVVGSITPVPDDDGFMQYAYAADAGGNLYRLAGASAGAAIGATAPGSSAWTFTQIAALGCDDGSTTCTRNRKFLFGPDVVETSTGYTLLVGSGDREKPLGTGTYGASNAVSNNFFRIDDQPTNSTWLSSESATCGAALICRDSLTPITTDANPTPAELAAKKGWYLGLDATENVVTSAITVSDNVTFSTFKPAVYDASACSGNLGEANVYNVNFVNAAPPSVLDTRFQRITGDGLPPSPVAGKVRLDDGTTVPFLIGGSKDSALEGMAPYGASSVSFPKSRSHWYIKQ